MLHVVEHCTDIAEVLVSGFADVLVLCRTEFFRFYFHYCLIKLYSLLRRSYDGADYPKRNLNLCLNIVKNDQLRA